MADAMTGLDEDDLAALERAGRVETIAARSLLPLDGLTVAIVLDGYFRAFRNAAFVRDVTLFFAARGDVLGMGTAFGERAAESGAQALGGGRVVLLAAETLAARAAATPGLYSKIARLMGRRLVRIQKKLEASSRASVEARVAEALGQLADDYGIPEAGGIRLDLPLSQEDLAGLAGTTRESCSSSVAALARQGLVRGGRLRGMVVLDRPGLQAIAG